MKTFKPKQAPFTRKLIPALLSLTLAACNLTGPATRAPEEAMAASTQVAQPASLPTGVPSRQAATSTPLGARLPPGTSVPYPDNIQLLWMVDEANGWAADTDGQLYRTADGGESWYFVMAHSGMQNSVGRSAFLDATHAWVVPYEIRTSPTLWRTTDGGLTWTHLTNNGLPATGADPLYRFTSPQDGLVDMSGFGEGGNNNRVFETHDGGASFAPIPVVGPTTETGLAEGVVQYCRLCGNAFYYDTSRAILVEGDLEKPPGVIHVRQSVEHGKHWSELNLPLPAGYEDALVVALPLTFLDDGHGYLPVRLLQYNPNGKAYDAVAIYTTIDFGGTWSPPTTILSNAEPFMLNFNDLDVKVLCGGNLCVSHDDAQTWETITPNVDFSYTDAHYVMAMTFPTPLNGWVILWESPATYKIYRTDDGGTTWTLLNH